MDTPDPTEALPPPPPPLMTRRLRRRPAEGKLGGVCAGIADYLGVDVTVVRLGALLVAIMGPGVPAYVVAWIIMPEAEPGEPRWSPSSTTGDGLLDRGPQLLGIGLLAVAALVVWDDIGWPGDRFLLPLVLIGAGVVLLSRTPKPPFSSASVAEPAPAALENEPLQPPRPSRPPRPRSKATPLALGAALIWGGIAGLTDVSIETGLAVGVGILAAGLVAGALIGGGRGLIFPALVLTVGLLGTAALDVPLRGGIGDRTWRVDGSADVDSPYRLAIGEAVLDLRALRPGPERTVEIEATIGLGHLEVLLPDGVPVHVRARAEAADVEILGRSDDGTDIDTELVEARRDGVGVIELDLAVGFGQIEVVR